MNRNCRKIRKQLPLLAGDDLSVKRTRRVREHIQSCQACRQELEGYNHALGEIRGWLNQAAVDWEEIEWRQRINRAMSAEKPSKKELAPWPFRPVWAGLAMLLVTIGLSWMLLKPVPPGREMLPQSLAAEEESSSQQEIIAITLVSKESGIKINWFLNKNFDLNHKEEKE